jgi:putative phage-type endonuclease
MEAIAISHQARIGCSEIAAALGISPWKTPYQLWSEKTGRSAPADIGGLLRVDLGNRLEQVVADLYMQRTGTKVIRDNREYHARDVALVGHIDRRIVGQRAGLEIKTSLSRFPHDAWGEEGTDQVPLHYLSQCVGYLMLTGYERWDLAVLLAGPEMRVYQIRPDADIFDGIKNGLREFWRYVETDTLPPLISLEDARLRWPVSKGGIVTPGIGTLYHLERLWELRAEIAELEAAADACELDIKEALGDAEAMVGDDGRTLCTWRNQTRRSVDVTLLRQAEPDLANRFTTEKPSRVFRLCSNKEII